MTPEEFARESWQSADTAVALPPLETLRARSDRFRRRIARRNVLEYAAGVFVVAGFGFTLISVPLVPMQIASAMIIAATIYVLWQLHRRAGNLPDDCEAGAVPVLVHQRAALARQRDALKGVFGWYIAPFLPGMALFFASPIVLDPPAVGSEAFFRLLLSGGVLLAISVGVWWINQMAARELQRQIEEIDALIAG
ncbi:hypothetical protein A6F68_01353 [Tsuneonella dongtanensis]|uniref:Uncharacterized protein n=1 Tax=Tsuneonella dongtanensis TaxID=692370 RepID=A0A1B2ACI5_9SPHN|nr:hypothetical protein [Tsuneonella dongtanensis]ANY19870.1 hypothetical protein A6F68_01353 [Tsuneonella dongtanensis]